MSGGSFSRVGVVGLGTMGAGIAEVLARGGLAVVGIEINQDALDRGRGNLEGSTGRAVKRGKLTEEAQREILDRITLSTDFADLAECDLVIEAVPERLELKRRVFEQLDRVCRADAVLATNTSSLSVTDIAVTTNRPAKIVGVHFFNPAPVMRLVEIIGTVLTEDGAVARVADLVRGLGKTPVTIGDRAGFVANRLLFGYLNQAATMLESGHATRDDIDAAMKTGGGLPMGPFTLMDLIGLDTCLEVLEAIYQESRDRRHAPAPVLRELVTAGLLGRKTGRGFYSYDKTATASAPAPDAETGAPAAEAPQPVVGVAGSGTLAVAIIAGAARAGSEVRYVAGDGDKVQAARSELEKALDADALARVRGGSELSELAGCELIIEAVSEDVSVKRSLFAAVDNVAAPGAVLATTASTVPVIDLAMATDRPGDVVGLHFPEPGGGLVEIAGTVVTSPGVTDKAVELAGRLGLTAVRCRDRAGFIVDALRFPYLNDAAAMLEAGYADADSIDAAMTLGCGYPTGPIADLDRLGLDRAVAVLRALYAESREAALAPAPLLEEYVTAGRTLR
ncbi:3-hydroxyacyl-CoA dehydrogenase family protein [Actinomadura rudentiformis]|uniref:3-hydroxybutyryl-CoA dehydrogenase n=1 Tax=Actinomadura rudentiformis TaxID=359158 RepID=A0A6H9YK62_9ACTN|nr:3-hydroxybutyryl-CoA dehydrogenase [Actinomadura rudentiformis]KAB2345978.1 3-hydroxybutyryl-CoA dehydrogenase [Actinomadura rudentiformis]